MNGFETILPFLKPIEHLILDDSISEVMVNGPDRIFIEKAGFIEVVRGVSLGEKSLMVAVKNIARRLGDDISESKPILDSRLPTRDSDCERTIMTNAGNAPPQGAHSDFFPMAK
jgi:Flp pilus assembly CpaF family ATPase